MMRKPANTAAPIIPSTFGVITRSVHILNDIWTGILRTDV